MVRTVCAALGVVVALAGTANDAAGTPDERCDQLNKLGKSVHSGLIHTRTLEKTVANVRAIGSQVSRLHVPSPPPALIMPGGKVGDSATLRRWPNMPAKMRVRIWSLYCQYRSRNKISEKAAAGLKFLVDKAFLDEFEARARKSRAAQNARTGAGSSRRGRTKAPWRKPGKWSQGGERFDKRRCPRISSMGEAVHKYVNGTFSDQRFARKSTALWKNSVRFYLKMAPAKSSVDAYKRLSAAQRWEHWRVYCGARGQSFSSNANWGFRWLHNPKHTYPRPSDSIKSGLREPPKSTKPPVSQTFRGKTNRDRISQAIYLPSKIASAAVPPPRAVYVPPTKVKTAQRRGYTWLTFTKRDIKSILARFFPLQMGRGMTIEDSRGLVVPAARGKARQIQLFARVRLASGKDAFTVTLTWDHKDRRAREVSVDYACTKQWRKCLRIRYAYDKSNWMRSITRQELYY